MVRASALLALIFAFLPPQDHAEHEFRWSLAKDLVADYQLVEIQGGKPVPRKDRPFLLYGNELLPDGGSSLLVSSYADLGPYFLFMLPKGKVKVGSKWASTVTVFKDARVVLLPMHGFKELTFVGVSLFRKMEKAQDRDCAVIESVFQYYEVKTDSKGRKKPAQQPLGTLRLTQWLTPGETDLVRGTWEIRGRRQEYNGIKQGEEPKSGTIDESYGIELRKDPLKLELREQAPAISEAVRKGVAAIRTLQEANGSFIDRSGSFARDFPVGVTSLALMALLHSGVKADDPALKAGFAYVRGQSFRKTYEVASILMLLETKVLPLSGVQDIADLTEEKAREAIQASITKEDRALAERATKWLVEHQTKAGTWGYPEGAEAYDHSNTQYAMLGLKSAARMGVRVPEATWRKAAAHWLETQRVGSGRTVALRIEGYEGQVSGLSETRTDETFLPGPWGYLIEKPEGTTEIVDQGYGSMTCAGLTSLIIAESELAAQKTLDDKLRRQFDTAKKQGLAWLQDNYSIRGAPPMAGFWSLFHFYYLYSLERVGVLFGIRTLGGHDWYLEGAMLLCRTQREDGSWLSYDEIPVLDTSFALLFLKRATLRVSTGYTMVR